MESGRGAVLLLLLSITATQVSGALLSSPIDTHEDVAAKFQKFWESVNPHIDYHGDETKQFRPDDGSYLESVSMVSLPFFFLSFVVFGIVLSICICKGKLGGCGSSGMPKEKAVARKVVLVCCGLIIGTASGLGLLSNYYIHLIVTQGGINWVVTVFQNFNNFAETAYAEAVALNLTSQLPPTVHSILNTTSVMAKESVEVQTIFLEWESARLYFTMAIYICAILLCFLALVALFYYHKIISRVAFVYGFLLMSLLVAFIGIFQVPAAVITADLCEDFKGGVQQYIPADNQYLEYYLFCEGKNPFEDFIVEAEEALAVLKNETNPDEKTKREIKEFEVMLAALDNMTCNSNTTEYSLNAFYEWNKEILCINFLNDLSYHAFESTAIGLFGLIMIFIGFRLGYQLTYSYSLLNEEMGLLFDG